MDCAPACLTMVARALGSTVSTKHAGELCATDANGTTAVALVRAARALGFDARAYRVRSVREIPPTWLPVIAYAMRHFVVIESCVDEYLMLLDPALGRRQAGIAEFDAIWSGIIVTLASSSTEAVNQPPQNPQG